MKKQHLFTLDIGLIRELHKKVGRGHRSQYVEDAIRKKLNGEKALTLAAENFSLGDVPIRRIMSRLLSYMQQRNDATAEVLCTLLLGELNEVL